MYTADFFIQKYAKEAAGGKFSASPCVRRELPVASPGECHVFGKTA